MDDQAFVSVRSVLVALAKCAQETERFTDMLEVMRTVVKAYCDASEELPANERALLDTAYKMNADVLRTSWSKIRDPKESAQVENTLCPTQVAAYRRKVGDELIALCRGAITLISDDLLPKTTSLMGRLHFLKLKSDYYRYMAEVAEDAVRLKLAMKSREVFYKAMALARSAQNIQPHHPIQLSLQLNFSVLLHDVLGYTDEACSYTTEVLLDAYASLDQWNTVHRAGAGDDEAKVWSQTEKILSALQNNLMKWNSKSGEQSES